MRERAVHTLIIINITPWDGAFLLTCGIHDYREFDRAVELAYEFYRKYPRETSIVVASAHESGSLGMTQRYDEEQVRTAR